ncbi:MAG: hypothetical protein HQL20_11060 [Candidatus Omnitrophica bacterium]|nr:hypothetical protein [Candidatus Omnitrophota bacterium]
MIFTTLFAEAAILFVAAQTGFLGGPKVLGNMALDSWFPTRFSAISDRLVSQNGVFIMGLTALIILLLTKGSIQLLVVLYSINVFITFVISQTGMGLHSLMNAIRFFKGTFQNFVFISVGVVDAGNFKGQSELHHLAEKTQEDLNRYVTYMNSQGFFAEGHSAVGVDVIDENVKLAITIAKKYENAVFFGGQPLFPEDTFWNKLFHNHTVFALQKRLYHQGLLFVIIPIRV